MYLVGVPCARLVLNDLCPDTGQHMECCIRIGLQRFMGFACDPCECDAPHVALCLGSVFPWGCLHEDLLVRAASQDARGVVPPRPVLHRRRRPFVAHDRARHPVTSCAFVGAPRGSPRAIYYVNDSFSNLSSDSLIESNDHPGSR